MVELHIMSFLLLFTHLHLTECGKFSFPELGRKFNRLNPIPPTLLSAMAKIEKTHVKPL